MIDKEMRDFELFVTPVEERMINDQERALLDLMRKAVDGYEQTKRAA